jgi:signal transduction histidine kinase
MRTTNGANVEADRRNLFERLRQVPVFQTLKDTDMACFERAVVVEAQAEEKVIEHGTPGQFFWIVLEGELRVVEGQETLGVLKANETGGEVPLLAGTPNKVDVVANTVVRAVRLDEDSFWEMMTSCKEVRQAILRNMARRMEGLQAIMVQREKLATLGTMAAGLMHELNNPAAAARRAASLLRANLMRLQMVGLKLSRAALTESQADCLSELQQRAMSVEKPKARSSIEESDAEDAMAQWLSEQGVADAWQMAPTLVGMGITREELDCTRDQFAGETLANALSWLESLISSMQLVGTVEESISRVTELALAVKKYAYEGKSAQQKVDVNESIASTLIILAHKLRNKEIEVVKEFSPSLPVLTCYGAGLNQIWTNLLDNSIDALPQKGRISIRTEIAGGQVVITIADNGAGIPPEHRKHIFEPFYTTKPAGVGTGLGLDIVQRIVKDKMHGSVTFMSEPGNTVFTVSIPATPQS